MTIKFFQNVNSIEELKEQYKKLCFQHHPDKGGKTEDMQQINAEFDELKKRVANIHRTKDGKTYQSENKSDLDAPDNFRKIINEIINFNIDVELCGSWLWVFKAYNYKEQLKDLGFFYCSGKKAWAWTDAPTKNKHHLTLDEIRRLHGSEIIKESEENLQITQGVA